MQLVCSATIGLVILFAAVACSGTAPTITGASAPISSSPTKESTVVPTFTPSPSATPSPTITDKNPLYLTTAQLSQLGNPTAPLVTKRPVVVQRFERGVMLIFAKAGNVFDPHGDEFIFALANDGRAWRIKDTFVETSKNPDDWYTCERKPGLRPERSGIPWRGFGKAWCSNSEVRDALGLAKIYEDVDDEASFQSFERGRSIQLSDWKGYPGWRNGQVYVIYYSSLSDPNFVSGKWE